MKAFFISFLIFLILLYLIEQNKLRLLIEILISLLHTKIHLTKRGVSNFYGFEILSAIFALSPIQKPSFDFNQTA